MKTIAIVGGGLSGTLVAVNLMRKNKGEKNRIILIEKSNDIGKGVAYSTNDMSHLLNVRAGKMSIIHGDSQHFYKWLLDNKYSYKDTDFVPRMIFGKYVADTFSNELKNTTNEVNIINDEAVGCNINGETIEITFKSSDIVVADKIVLATGNYIPAHPYSTDLSFIDSDRYFQNPWVANVFSKLNKDETVLIIGTGLTMVDMVMTLHKIGHKGKIIALSKNGYVPVVHEFITNPYPSFSDELKNTNSLLEAFKTMRSHLKEAKKSGISWQAVVDAIRPCTQEVWYSFSTKEKQRFMRDIRHIWGVARHRMAPQSSEVINSLIEKKQLDIYSGRIYKISAKLDKIIIDYTDKKKKNKYSIEASLVLNCTGPEANIEKMNNPVIKSLLNSELISADPLKLGMDALPNGQLKDKNKNVSSIFYSIGPDLKGILWESTAVPEIRLQAYHLSELIG